MRIRITVLLFVLFPIATNAVQGRLRRAASEQRELEKHEVFRDNFSDDKYYMELNKNYQVWLDKSLGANGPTASPEKNARPTLAGTHTFSPGYALAAQHVVPDDPLANNIRPPNRVLSKGKLDSLTAVFDHGAGGSNGNGRGLDNETNDLGNGNDWVASYHVNRLDSQEPTHSPKLQLKKVTLDPPVTDCASAPSAYPASSPVNKRRARSLAERALDTQVPKEKNVHSE
jgi:hypothetical protein